MLSLAVSATGSGKLEEISQAFIEVTYHSHQYQVFIEVSHHPHYNGQVFIGILPICKVIQTMLMQTT